MIQKTLCTLLLMLGCTMGFAKEEVVFPEATQVIELAQLDDAMLEELIKGERPEVVVSCREGTEVPVEFMHNVGVFGIRYFPSLSLYVQKACYLRVVGKDGYISFDMVNWQPAEELLSGNSKVKVKINNGSVLVHSETVPCEDDDDDDDDDLAW